MKVDSKPISRHLGRRLEPRVEFTVEIFDRGPDAFDRYVLVHTIWAGDDLARFERLKAEIIEAACPTQ